MKVDQDIEDLLYKYGFYKSGSCNCGGIFNQKYRNPLGYIVYIRPKQRLFKIKQGNEELLGLHSIDKPNAPLDELDSYFKTAYEEAIQTVSTGREIPGS